MIGRPSRRSAHRAVALELDDVTARYAKFPSFPARELISSATR